MDDHGTKYFACFPSLYYNFKSNKDLYKTRNKVLHEQIRWKGAKVEVLIFAWIVFLHCNISIVDQCITLKIQFRWSGRINRQVRSFYFCLLRYGKNTRNYPKQCADYFYLEHKGFLYTFHTSNIPCDLIEHLYRCLKWCLLLSMRKNVQETWKSRQSGIISKSKTRR